ncbi:Elongation factor P [Smittium mucronatum]|uniref:Elongation factor P n=1 Tax=Smittium mucronatum TaxID=133383 RepID=A0A1R0GS19_9FUNG|nr:Elongation factor P [Smittium mucronatum]
MFRFGSLGRICATHKPLQFGRAVPLPRFYKADINSLKIGQVFEKDGSPYILLEKYHGGTGRGSAVVKDGMQVTVQILEPEPGPVSWKLPSRHTYKVESISKRAPHAKGGNYVPATLTSGAEVKVPDFVNPGDMIIVDTETREYISKA